MLLRLAAHILLASQAVQAAPKVRTGLDMLLEQNFAELKGKRVGLITNQTGRTGKNKPILQAFLKAGEVRLAAVFSPEHGFAGVVDEGKVADDRLKLPDGRKLPLYSLYGSTLAPTAAMLSGLDALVFDIQDVGARFYTYSTTMAMAMEAAAKADLDFYVLDRPNPVTGEIVEGPLLSGDVRHFIAYLPVPVRHGMTMGELARLYNVMGRVEAQLHVIPLQGWSRDRWYDRTGLPWTKPSPNMPSLESAILYPGIACFEAVNLSVGRGTPVPFQWVGAPWLDAEAVVSRLKAARLPGVEFEPQEFTPAKDVHQGKKCRGVRVRIKDRDRVRALDVFAHMACALRDLHPLEFGVDWVSMGRHIGGEHFRQLYESGAPPERMIEFFREDARKFELMRRPFLLY